MCFRLLLPRNSVVDEEAAGIFGEVEVIVGDFDEFGTHGFLEGGDFYAATGGVLDIFDERDEVAITRHDDDRIEIASHLDGIDRDTNIPVPLLGSIGEDLEVFGLDFIATLLEGFEEFLLHALHGTDAVGDGADELPISNGGHEDIFEAHLLAVEDAGAVIHILDVDEDADPLFWKFCHTGCLL